MRPSFFVHALGFLVLSIAGCGELWPRKVPPPIPPLKILVAQVVLEAPVSTPTDLYSFDEPPAAEVAPALMAQLVDDIQGKAQRVLTEQMAGREGFRVVPFPEARRLGADLGAVRTPFTHRELQALGAEAGVDLVVSGRILDYGVVKWQYWVTGLAASMLAETLVVGAATGWNPVAMAAIAGSELVTDLPFWWGGAYVAGWAFRPVRIEVAALQQGRCGGVVWSDQSLVVLIPGKTLAEYPPDMRRRKEVQLEVNLTRALNELAESAERELRTQPCEHEGD